MILVAVLVIVTLASYYLQYKWKRRRMEIMAEKLPGPKPLPVIGNSNLFLGLQHNDFINKLNEVVNANGEPLTKIWLGNMLVIVLTDPKDIEKVLSNAKLINKSVLFQFFQERSLGAFSHSGEEWRKHRRITNKMFSRNLMDWYITVFNEQSSELVEYLSHIAPYKSFDVSHSIMRCTLDTICRTATGVHMNLQKNGQITFPDDLTESSEMILERMYKIWLHPTFILKRTALGKGLFERIKRIHNFTLGVLQKRRQETKKFRKDKFEENSSEDSVQFHDPGYFKDDESTLNMKLYIDQMFEYADVANIDESHLAKSVLDIIIGGADTSAIADSYVLVFLGMYKEWQKKVHDEQDEIFGNSDREVTLTDIDKMVNLDMVIKEILRLYTAPHTVRELHEDIKLDKYVLPAGAIVYASTYMAHRDQRYWSHPHSFHPEHFLPENVANRPRFSYMPFAFGPRSCPGSKYGMMSMKVVLSHILRRFKVETDLKFEDMRHKPSLMLELIGGYNVRLIPRTNNNIIK